MKALTLVLVVSFVAVSGDVFAQAAIAGTVFDASGARLSGVAVQASSPALIERIRTAVTDGAGQYRIEDLRSGRYHVRFTLTGWSLLEASFGGTFFGVGNFEREPNPTRDLIRIVEQCTSGCPANGSIPGLAYRSQDFRVAYAGSYLWKGSMSYVTGAHSLKIGFQHTLMTDDRTWMTNSQNLTYRFNNGVPNQLTQSISPWVNDARVAWDGLFVQEQWRRDRLTVQGAARFDRARSWFPAQQEGPSRFLTAPIVIPETVAWTATRMSRREWASCTTCSAPGRRPSR